MTELNIEVINTNTRTNPRPDTVPWVITGAMKVTKLLDDFDVKQICPNAPDRQGGNKTLRELGF